MASAGTIQIEVGGFVTDFDGDLGLEFTPGESFSAVYSFQSDARDLDPAADRGVYVLDSFSGLVGDYAFSSLPDGGFGSPRISTFDNTPTFGDQFFVDTSAAGKDVGDARLVLADIFFRDFDGVFLPNDDLVLGAPDLALMEQFGFALGFDSPTQPQTNFRVLVRGRIEFTRVVPEPELVPLLLTALAALGLVRGLRITRASSSGDSRS